MTRSVRTTWVNKAQTAVDATSVCKAVSDAMDEVGFQIETSATGQIDLSTTLTTFPATAVNVPTLLGYQMRKLVSAGKPTIYARIQYLLSGYTTPSHFASTVFVRIHYGTAISGANVSGVFNNFEVASTPGALANAPVNPWPFAMASDGANYFTWIVQPLGSTSYTGAAYPILAHTMERTRDYTTGAYDSEGWWVAASNYVGAYSGPTIVPIGGPRFAMMNIPLNISYVVPRPRFAVPFNANLSSGSIGGAVTLYPLMYANPGVKAMGSAMVGHWVADNPAMAEFDATLYGVTMRFYSCCVASSTIVQLSDATELITVSGGVGVAMRVD